MENAVSDDRNDLLALVAVLAPFSLLSVGGGSAIIPGLKHQAVDVYNWVSAEQFIDMFAVARASPGPGTMLSTLIGWKLAGWLGALVATLSLMMPSALLCYGVFRLTDNHREKKWNKALRKGLAPVGVGLSIAGSITLFRLAGGGFAAAAVTALSTVILLVRPNLSVVVVLIIGSALTVSLRLIAG